MPRLYITPLARDPVVTFPTFPRDLLASLCPLDGGRAPTHSVRNLDSEAKQRVKAGLVNARCKLVSYRDVPENDYCILELAESFTERKGHLVVRIRHYKERDRRRFKGVVVCVRGVGMEQRIKAR